MGVHLRAIQRSGLNAVHVVGLSGTNWRVELSGRILELPPTDRESVARSNVEVQSRCRRNGDLHTFMFLRIADAHSGLGQDPDAPNQSSHITASLNHLSKSDTPADDT